MTRLLVAVALPLLLVAAVARPLAPAELGAPPPETVVTASAGAAGDGRPMRVAYPPGAIVQADRGVFYADPRSGSVEGWYLSERYPPQDQRLAYLVSPSGRSIAWGDYDDTAGSPGHWRLYDTQADTLRELAARPLAFSPDEARLLSISADQDTLTVGRADDGTVERVIDLVALGKRPGTAAGASWSPAGDALLIQAFETDWRLVRYRLADGDAAVAGRPGEWSGGWSPDGRRYFLAGEGLVSARDAADDRLLWSLDAAALGLPPGASPRFEPPVVAPDGKSAAFFATLPPGRGESFGSTRLFVIDPANGSVRFSAGGAVRCGPPWSADGRWLLVDGRRGDAYGSYLIAADGSAIRALPSTAGGVLPSPVDPEIAAYRRFDQAIDRLQVIGLADGAERLGIAFAPTFGWATGHDPQWLTDGRMVAYAPQGATDGCGAGPPPPELEIRFP